MPLIVFCGTPLSGKSTNARYLHSYFNNSILISDEDKLMELGPEEIYKNAQKEKEIRSWLKSEVQRNLSSPDNLVILDSTNYIKGFRYELYCLSKQFKTTYALVECLPPKDFNELLNNFKDNNKRSYSKEIYNELQQRYEPPSSSNRWEEPLFRVDFGIKLPLNEIDEAIFKKTPLKPNRSTQQLPLTTDNFLFELDNQIQNVIKQIQSALALNQLQNIKIENTNVMVNLNEKIPITELNKFKRRFINYIRLNPIKDKESIVTAFVQFINNGSNF